MYKFALVGCGNISHRHAENINRVGTLTAVCDIVPEKADALAEKYKVRSYYSIDGLLENEPAVEIMVVCTPNGLHAEHSIQSLQKGKHVLCEKPLSISMKDGKKMVETAEACKRKIYVVKQNRYNEPVQHLKQLLEENALGKIYSFQLNCFWNRPQQYYTNSWRGTKELDGGILYTQFSHFIDLLYWFLGDVKTAQGYKHNYGNRSHFEIEDTGAAILKMKCGAIGTINYTINSYNKNLEGSFSIFGEKGSVKIGGQYLNTLEWYEVAGNERPTLAVQPSSNDYGFYQGSMSNHHKVYDDLIRSLDGKGSLLEARDALSTIEIIEKIYAATREV
jgi:UDP-N-acetyl-2-amino-2-deoxyglucuronate dehydrogenase